MRIALLVLALWCAATSAGSAPQRLVVWGWERPEDLRFIGPDVEVAVQTGFVVLSGDAVIARGRRFPLLAPPGQVTTAVVHIQIDHHHPLAWSAQQRAAAARAVLALLRASGVRRAQIDFEVRRSERRILLDLLSDVRRDLPRDMSLSMTALASWCDTEGWLGAAPVDEIVPMLFRMGPGGAALRGRLEAGGDFADPRCRAALAVSTDAPLRRAPTQRRIYLFSPRSWTAADFQALRRRVGGWASNGG
ncbi:hypothetical protein [Phenylobacterium sp.]|uniref:hypothetical protein n=1 Tax=Phenylobacterium sp. TaxID=1871053 RepID=UPI003565BE96